MDESNESAKGESSIHSSLVPVASLNLHCRAELLKLMSSHFANVDEGQFFQDLDEKQWIVLLEDKNSGRISGFSTIMLLEAEIAGRPLAGVFAGDTIIEPEYWGQSAWLYHWGHCAYELARGSRDPRAALLLLTSTHRSYRFLPGFFRAYYPHPDRPTPADVQERLDALVRLKFPQEYDAATGIVSPENPLPVRAGREDPAATVRDDPHVQFFHRINPRFAAGDFLACYAECAWENLTPLGRRMARSEK